MIDTLKLYNSDLSVILLMNAYQHRVGNCGKKRATLSPPENR